MFDVLILGGTVIDGSGKPGKRADVGIEGDRIAAVGYLSDATAVRVIDATGLAVSPGFIDTHAHSDGALLVDPQHANELRQGVTTEILGQDGLSYAPLSRENYRMYRHYLSGLLGLPPEELDMGTVEAFRSYYYDIAINTAYLVPHGAVRLQTVGFRDVPLAGDDLELAKRIIREGIEQGAVGFSTGMSYFPNSYSTTDELIELCRACDEAGGVYVTHLRNQNTERGFGGGGVAEALEIGRRSGVRVHFSHYRTTAVNAGKVAEVMKDIDKAEKEGVDCSLELYPYPAGSGYPLYYFPGWFHEGGPEAMRARLLDKTQRARVVKYLTDKYTGQWEDSVFTYMKTEKNKRLEGMWWPDVAKERGVSIAEMVCQVELEEDFTVGYRGGAPQSVAVWRQVSRDEVELLSRPDYMVGSDAIPLGSMCHPRAFGTFPRFLGRLRRQFPIMSLETMVQRVTDNPASRFGLKRRGRILKGYYADIAVFDPDRFVDVATYDDPRQFPVGMHYVLVNGAVAVDHERCTGVMAGRPVPE